MGIQECLVHARDDADVRVHFYVLVLELLYLVGREVHSRGVRHFLEHAHVDLVTQVRALFGLVQQLQQVPTLQDDLLLLGALHVGPHDLQDDLLLQHPLVLGDGRLQFGLGLLQYFLELVEVVGDDVILGDGSLRSVDLLTLHLVGVVDHPGNVA